ncbi:glycosyltransferase [Secundilactobacillus mixtipabuli]|nr:glycosyltransferase [Secundilactobacillus mixtipabuli]
MVGGGVEQLILNAFQSVDHDKYLFDFIIDSDSTIIPKRQIHEFGGEIFLISPYQNLFKYFSDLNRILRQKQYEIVHANISTLNIFPLFIAWVNKVPVRISHTHNLIAKSDGFKKNFLKYSLRLFSNFFANAYVAPTYETGRWLFGRQIADKKLLILKNGVNISKFKFDSTVRIKLRKQLKIRDEDILIGDFGRLVKGKKHIFAMKVLQKMHKLNPKYKLLIIGEGPQRDYLTKIAASNDFMFLLPNRSNIEDYYSAVDGIIFPSSREAFGMVAVEAQISGLQVFVSKGVPDDVDFKQDLIVRISNWNVDSWCSKIINKINTNRINFDKSAFNSGFSLQNLGMTLQNYYDQQLEIRGIYGENTNNNHTKL